MEDVACRVAVAELRGAAAVDRAFEELLAGLDHQTLHPEVAPETRCAEEGDRLDGVEFLLRVVFVDSFEEDDEESEPEPDNEETESDMELDEESWNRGRSEAATGGTGTTRPSSAATTTAAASSRRGCLTAPSRGRAAAQQGLLFPRPAPLPAEAGLVSDSSASESGSPRVEERVAAMERASHDMARASGRKRASCGVLTAATVGGSSDCRAGGRGHQRRLRRSSRDRKGTPARTAADSIPVGVSAAGGTPGGAKRRGVGMSGRAWTRRLPGAGAAALGRHNAQAGTGVLPGMGTASWSGAGVASWSGGAAEAQDGYGSQLARRAQMVCMDGVKKQVAWPAAAASTCTAAAATN
ncbi:uncharacterized protein C2845_PM08G20890 [Panicum miliaceum]|uniref:Uncharacterized protein n=1 Tax=Panicum miliaceum TaxID=4540 RepID=A0A3L6R0W6_PANMI|nr:uncharacterized protein C2845_PM08G20890 [Panicum miliaceum]